MSKNPSDDTRNDREDRRENYQTDGDRSKRQGERPLRRESMADKQAGQKFTSDEDIVRRRPA